MPIIFAQAIMFIPAAITGLQATQREYRALWLWYNFVFAVLIILLRISTQRYG